jgi:hypothetical protein
VIAAALGAAFAVTAHDSIGIADRYAESHDAQIASAYLATDVQSNGAIAAGSCSSGSSVIAFGYADGTIANYCYGSGTLTRTYTGGPVATLVHHAAAAPTVTCTNPSGCAVGSQPTKVAISVSERNAGTGANDFTYSLTGSRRAYVNGGGVAAGPSGYPPVLALGGSGTQINLNGNHAGFHVNGNIVVNSSSSSAVSSNSSAFTYSQLQIFSPGKCSTCSYVNRPDRVVDPLAGMPPPSSAGLPTNPAKVGTTYSPGIYTGTFSPDGTLSPGVYILQNGLSLSGNSAVVGAGVLFYITGGSVNVSGNATINVSPPTTGTYSGISIWQAASDTTAFSISGNGGASSVGGLIYLPGVSSATLGTGNGTLLIGSVIAPNIVGGGNGNVCVGYSAAQCAAF